MAECNLAEIGCSTSNTSLGLFQIYKAITCEIFTFVDHLIWIRADIENVTRGISKFTDILVPEDKDNVA